MPNADDPLVAVVLPPREGFGPGRTGALGLLARRLVRTPGFRTAVIGGPQDGAIFPGVDFHAVEAPLFSIGNLNLRYAVGAARLLRRLKPALIEVHNRPEIALSLTRKLPSVPVTLMLNNDPREMRRARSPGDRAALIERLALVVISSDWLRGALLEGLGAPARKPIVLPNCLDLAEVPPAVPKERLILFAGRVVAEKGPDAFVAACAQVLPRLSGWRAEIIGADRFRADSPETGFVRQIQTSARAAGVAMLGYRDHPEVLNAMRRAAIAVVPSRWNEPFGLVALEAMACGAALISAPNGGLPEVGGDAAVYASPDDPGALAAAIEALARDGTRRDALAEAGIARARQFDVPIVAARLAGLRRGILGAGF